MKNFKPTLAAIIFISFLAAGCAHHTCPTYADTYKPVPLQASLQTPEVQEVVVSD